MKAWPATIAQWTKDQSSPSRVWATLTSGWFPHSATSGHGSGTTLCAPTSWAKCLASTRRSSPGMICLMIRSALMLAAGQVGGQVLFAPRVGRLHCVDASEAALDVARQVLADQPNVEFHLEDISNMSLADDSCDFGYSLGVLHHVPDTELATRSCVAKLKPGAPFLVYLYYDLEGAGLLRIGLLKMVTVTRRLIARMPHRLKAVVTSAVALVVYLPLARIALFLERTGHDPSMVPLFQYRNRSFYAMRNDALDRFGTRLEKRFSRDEVRCLLEQAGLERVTFSKGPPWWVAVGWRVANC